jgi:RND family efflux transporter MFP subunit
VKSRRRATRFTRYLEATGNTAPIKNVDLVARVQGFLQSINYKDGAFVKEGTTLFTIEPETYKLKLEQAQAAEAGAQASVKQAEADFKRQSELVQRQAVSQATLDTSTSTRDNAQANLQQAQVNTKIARSITAIPMCRAVRRHRQRASGLGRRTGRRRRRRSLPPSWRSIRSM